MIPFAKAIYRYVDYFAVAKVCELVSLRRNFIYKPVLILSPLLINEIETAIRFGGEISVDGLERLRQVQIVAMKMNKIAKVHIQVDTGMRRFGVTSLKEYVQMLDNIRDGTHVTLVGVYSHFYSNDSRKQARQREIFEKITIETHRRQFYPLFHISASGGAMDKQNLFDMVRLGIALYEQYTELTSNIIAIKKLKAGEGLGYDHKYVANRDTLIGIVGIGYGDGIFRMYAKEGKVSVNGKIFKIVGNICMDCLFIDIGNDCTINVGDEVNIFGNFGINICEVAAGCDTITYEILSSITKRVKRCINASNNRSLQRTQTT